MKKFEPSRQPGATTETNISNDSEQVNTQENKGSELVQGDSQATHAGIQQKTPSSSPGKSWVGIRMIISSLLINWW